MKPALKLALLAAACCLGACEKKPATNAKVEEPPAIEVEAAEVRAEPRARSFEVVGTVLPKLRAVIEAKLSGRIEAMPARLGQVVRKGDLLVELDSREVQARLDQAQANRDQAQTELRRLTALLQQQALTQAEFDSGQARFRVADAAFRGAETMLAYARLTAPFSGVVVRRFVDVGDLAAPGKPLLELHDPAQKRFIAEVPDTLISRIEPGAELDIDITVLNRRFKGSVVEIAPMGDPVSRTFRVELDFAGDEAPSGMFGRLLIPGAEEAVLLVPATAVHNRGQMELAYVIRDERAELRLVKTGKRFDDRVQILSGLSAGDQVVTKDVSQLRDGQRVQVRP